MTSSKTTKRALTASIVSIFLCAAMLIGTTFAWFTDEAGTSVNKIQAGNLDLGVEYTLDGETWNELESATDLFGSEGALFEPGYTRVVALRISNKGNLALKYKLSMNIASETKGVNKAGNNFALSDYLKVKTSPVQAASYIGDIMLSLAFDKDYSGAIGWTEHDFTDLIIDKAANGQEFVISAGGEAHYFIMQVYMPETVGNEANAISQDKTPSIKFGVNVVATQAAVEKDSYGTDYDENAEYPEVIAAGKTFTGTATLSTGITATAPDAIAVKAVGSDANVTITGGNFDGGKGGNNQCVHVREGATVTIKGGTFTVGSDASGDGNSVIESNGGNIVIEGGFFQTDYAWNGFYYVLNQYNSNPGTITVKGGTFVNYNPANGDDNLGGNFVADGYKVVQETQANGDVWYTVVAE